MTFGCHCAISSVTFGLLLVLSAVTWNLHTSRQAVWAHFPILQWRTNIRQEAYRQSLKDVLIAGTGLSKVSKEKLFAVGRLHDTIKKPELNVYDLPAMSQALLETRTSG